MEERRKETRSKMSEDAIAWDLNHMTAGCRNAKIVDVSRNGLCLESAESLAQGAYIAIDFRGMIVCGTVKHTRPTPGGFVAGIRIGEVLDPLRESLVSGSSSQDIVSTSAR